MDTMRARRWPAITALAGLALVGLSVVPGWLIHVRHIGGHGLTHLDTLLNAWQLRSLPVLAAGVLLAAVATGIAVSRLLGSTGRQPQLAFATLGASVASLALLVASAWPISQESHASAVELFPGWPLAAGIGLAVFMTLASAIAAPRSTRLLGVAGALALILSVGSVGLRIVGLHLAEGTGRHYADGSYTREAIAGQPTETLTIDGGTFAVNDRWSGSFEGDGLVVALEGDPACPDVRGSYHLFGISGTDDVRFEAIVDPCADGERDSDLSTGIWRRNP